MSKLKEMFTLQQELNDATNGSNWELGTTKNGKIINWKRCIYMECAEMIDSFAWKHWKSIDTDPDWENLQIEVVDVWHFVMSLVLQEYKTKDLGSIDELVSSIQMMPFYEVLQDEPSGFASEALVMSDVESIMQDVLASKTELTSLLAHFFDLVRLSNLNINSLYQLYIGKNILNQFRQDNGYKDGTYIKIWGDKEDNVVMKTLWEENCNITSSQLYAKLELYYSSL